MKTLALLGVVLFIGLGAVGCDSGSSGPAAPGEDTISAVDGYVFDTLAPVDLVSSDLSGPDTAMPDVTPDLLGEIVPDAAPDVPCVPNCEGPDGPMECGDDGCGGFCGTCNFGDDCVDGVCVVPINCGDGQCVEGETCEDCAVDCGKCPECGDEECNGEETCLDCPGDCGACCGDGACIAEHGEDCFICEADCGICCGDNACVAEHGEDCTTCTEDCGLCCGDGECTEAYQEDCFTCAVDCGQCCGDGECVEAHGETCATCPADCGACPECGDGECNGVETCGSCIADCPCALEEVCFEGACCTPDCGDKVCGDDGCGGSCGDCGAGTGCAADGTCIPAGSGSCIGIYECRVGCPAGDGLCLLACDQAGSVEAQETYTAWVDCLDETGYFDCPEDDDQCSDDAFAPCEDLVAACLQGEDSCGEIFDCQQMDCPSDDSVCIALCEFNGSDEAQDLVAQLYDCVAEQCPDGTTWECWLQATAGPCGVLADICWSEPCESLCDGYDCGYGGCNEHCGDCAEGLICSPDQQCIESQELDCLGIYECIVACPEDDDTCPSFCFSQGTDQAKTEYNGWLNCLEDSGYYDCPDGDTDCTGDAFESCMPTIQICLAGELTCGEIFDCQQLDCPSGDSTCATTCFWNGTATMQDNYELMMDCFTADCPDGLTYTCIEESLLGACSLWTGICWDGCMDGCAAGTHCLYGGCGQWCDVTCPDGLACDVTTGLCN